MFIFDSVTSRHSSKSILIYTLTHIQMILPLFPNKSYIMLNSQNHRITYFCDSVNSTLYKIWGTIHFKPEICVESQPCVVNHNILHHFSNLIDPRLCNQVWSCYFGYWKPDRELAIYWALQYLQFLSEKACSTQKVHADCPQPEY